MNWKPLLNPEIRNFILRHEHDDVAALGLQKPPGADWPYPLILDQIKARQKARDKIPAWLTDNLEIVLPAPSVIEQASSSATAFYKASLLSGKAFADLSGGAGVDCQAFARRFESGFCIEQDKNAASLIDHNLKHLISTPVTVIHGTAENFIGDMPKLDLVYIDPQRRHEGRKGIYDLQKCSPNVFDLLPVLKSKARHVMIKTSPMLDIHKAMESLGPVWQVHILEWRGECKEVLYLIDFEKDTPNDNVEIITVRINDDGDVLQKLSFTKSEESQTTCTFSQPLKYLFEPGPAFQKSGGFNMIALRYGMNKLHPHTHLYTSDTLDKNFPGRIFEIYGTYPVERKALPFKKCNLSVRNFPSSADDLKKKLGLKDGGGDYLFACTLADEKKVLLHVRKPC